VRGKYLRNLENFSQTSYPIDKNRKNLVKKEERREGRKKEREKSRGNPRKIPRTN
jgi:hypothetical protein